MMRVLDEQWKDANVRNCPQCLPGQLQIVGDRDKKLVIVVGFGSPISNLTDSGTGYTPPWFLMLSQNDSD